MPATPVSRRKCALFDVTENPQLINILLTAAIALVQLLSASILSNHWREIIRCRDRLHALEGSQNIVHGALKAKGIL